MLVDGLTYLFYGMIFGFFMSVPVGPVNVICLQRTLYDRGRHGFIIGLGAALGDAFYGFLAAFGLNAIHGLIDAYNMELRIFGALIMGVFAARVWLAKPHLEKSTGDKTKGIKRATLGALVLTLTNPGVFLGFIAFFSAAGLSQLGTQSGDAWIDGGALVLGVFFGAAGWWATLAASGHWLRDRITDATLVKINHVSAIGIALFALGALASIWF